MHVVNLVIGYTLGIKENTKTHNETVNGDVKKVKMIVTPGGEFTEGLRIIKLGKEMCNYFTGSPQRKDKLEDIVSCHHLPKIALTNYPDTRVAYASKLFGTLIANHYAFRKIDDNNFDKLFGKLTDNDWETMQEMEAISSALAGYAVNEAQASGGFISSLRPYFRLALLAITNKKRFKVISTKRHGADTKLHQVERKV